MTAHQVYAPGMSDDLTPGPALDCDNGCGALSPVREEDRDKGDCPLCGEFALPVAIEVCPNGDDCNDQAHDFGRGVHVVSAG